MGGPAGCLPDTSPGLVPGLLVGCRLRCCARRRVAGLPAGLVHRCADARVTRPGRSSLCRWAGSRPRWGTWLGPGPPARLSAASRAGPRGGRSELSSGRAGRGRGGRFQPWCHPPRPCSASTRGAPCARRRDSWRAAASGGSCITKRHDGWSRGVGLGPMFRDDPANRDAAGFRAGSGMAAVEARGVLTG